MTTNANNTFDISDSDGVYSSPDNLASAKTESGNTYCNDHKSTFSRMSESHLNSASGKPRRFDRRLAACLVFGLILILTFVTVVVVVLVKISSDISDINSRMREDRVQNEASFSEIRHTLNESIISLDEQLNVSLNAFEVTLNESSTSLDEQLKVGMNVFATTLNESSVSLDQKLEVGLNVFETRLQETKTSLEEQTASAARRVDQVVKGNNLVECNEVTC